MRPLSITFLVFCVILPLHFLSAQVFTKTGEIFGSVTDEKKSPLSGVLVTVESSEITSQQDTTGQTGGFRFINLPPGIYMARFTLPGFAAVSQEKIRVITGGHVELAITMNSAMKQEIKVEAPLLDRKKTENSVVYTEEYLQQIPNGRDPWFLLAMTPGVDSSRLNTGTGSVFQAAFFGRGDSFINNTWHYDGVNHTDPATPGMPPAYYDFEAFEEIQIVTGAMDVSTQTGGVAIRLVTKKGGNMWAGQGSFFRTKETRDYGFHAGGPLIKDKLFLWGGYRLVNDQTLEDILVRESSTLQDINAKLNLDWTSSHSSQFGYFRGAKNVEDLDLTGNSAPEARADQTTAPGQGIWSLEHTWIPDDNLLLSLRYAFVGTESAFNANGGTDKPMISLQAIGRLENTGFTFSIDNQSHNINVDGNYYKENSWDGDHEFRFGFEYRTSSLEYFSAFGNGIYISDYYQITPNAALTSGSLIVQHPLNVNSTAERASAYFSDTFRKDRLTLMLGIRYDYQTGRNLASEVSGVPGYEQFVGPIRYAGGDPGIATHDFSPRLGLTYALTEDNKTLLKANYARYYDAFNPNFLSHSNPTAVYNGVIFSYVNANADKTITPDELVDGPDFFGGNTGGPFDLDAFVASRLYDDNLSNAWTNEFLFSLERELTDDLSIGATLTYRRYGNFLRILPFGVSTADYIPGGTFTADTDVGSFSVPYFVLGFEHDGTAILSNIKDYQQSYKGLDILVQKRMRNDFLLNASATIQRQNGHYNGGDSLAIQTQLNPGLGATYPFDPTNLPFLQDQPYSYAGFGGSVNPFSDWSFKLSGVYQFPWTISTGMFLRYQQGYPMILFGRVEDNSLRAFYGVVSHNILVEPIGSRRYDNIFTIDFQAQKTFDFEETGKLTAILTIFNATNSRTITSRGRIIDQFNFNQVQAKLDERSYRFGLRFSF